MSKILARSRETVDGRLDLADDALYVLPAEKEIRYADISSVSADKFSDDLNIYHRRSAFFLDNLA
jgi:hypothetical protein